MRVSVVVVFDSVAKRFRVFTEDTIEALFPLLQAADLIIGFNIKRFDYRVLGAYTHGDLKALPTFDILEDVHNRLGFRLGLDHLATETLKRRKTADGLQAVEWFRQGEMGKLTDYCRQDVEVTRDLFHFGVDHGQLIYREKRSGQRLRLLVDWKLKDMLNVP
jgi:DEAD/DEAH box helicase domain-containing protein